MVMKRDKTHSGLPPPLYREFLICLLFVYLAHRPRFYFPYCRGASWRGVGRPGKSRRLQCDERPCKKKKQDPRSQRLKRQQKTVKCKNYGVLGHNSKTCYRRASNEEAVMGSHNVQAPQDYRGGSNMSRDDGGASSSVNIIKKQKNHPTLLPPCWFVCL
ncbi:gag-pol polyprotein [Striga asiatica]|uniref:Gag-pol polyprotein n=1 Tax=Striga asiatica TaxID=4170 RepID=A0A5A7PW90_STRAF|nr:gag-pol polyprotein [Striga asiatica]